MTEEKDIGKAQGNPEDNGKKQPEVKEIVLTITKTAKGIGVNGPGDGTLFNKYLCFGMLEDAKDYIKSHNALQNQSKIVQANQPSKMMNFARKFKR